MTPACARGLPIRAASSPAQAEFSITTATNQPDGQITKSLSSPSLKNKSLAASGKSRV
jgi:hypothetical protein